MKKYLILLFLWIVFLPSSLYATELPMTEQLFFKSQLKEYACKIIDPSLRHENIQLATLDIKNLQEKIFIKLINSEEHLKAFKKFIIENIWTAKVFSSFKKDLLNKQKFESLNNISREIIDFSDLNNLEPLNAKVDIILFDKFLYKSSFNSTINMPKFSEKQPQIYISASNNLEQDYYEITRDTQNITDEESLKKYGPSVIERSEKILFGNDDSLRLDYAGNLIYYAGICRTLLKYGMNLPETTKRKYLLEYSTNEIYQKVPLYNYKYAAVLTSLNLLEADKKYDDMLAFALKVKKETFEQLIIDFKRDIVFKICYIIVYLCEPKQEHLEIGKENCYQLNNLIDISDGPYYPTPEHKRMTKLKYTFYLTSKLYAKYKCYNEEMNELDIILNSPPPTIDELLSMHKELVDMAKTRKAEIAPFVLYIKTDKEKIISELEEKTVTLTVEFVNGLNQPISCNFSAISDNPNVATVMGGPAVKRRNRTSTVFNIKINNIGECNIKVAAAVPSSYSTVVPPKIIPIRIYRAFAAEASFISNGIPYIKLKNVITTGAGTYVDQDITSPEYKYGGTGVPMIMPVALERNTTPNFTAKIKIISNNTIISIKMKTWAIMTDGTPPDIGEYDDILPDADDNRFFTVNLKLKYDQSNSTYPKGVRIGYEIISINYKTNNGNVTDDKCLFSGKSGPIPLYYSWKRPLKEPVYERVAYYASNWAAGIDDAKNIADNLFDGLRKKKQPLHNYVYGNNWGNNDYSNLHELIYNKLGMCKAWAEFFEGVNAFHGIKVNIRAFRFSPNELNKYSFYLTDKRGIGNESPTKYGHFNEPYRIIINFLNKPIFYNYPKDNDLNLEKDPDPADDIVYKACPKFQDQDNEPPFQKNYWRFDQHFVCFYKGYFYDTSFGNDPFQMAEPGNQEIVNYADITKANDPFINYFKNSISYLGGVFEHVDNLSSPAYKGQKEFTIDINDISKFYLKELKVDWRGGLKHDKPRTK